MWIRSVMLMRFTVNYILNNKNRKEVFYNGKGNKKIKGRGT